MCCYQSIINYAVKQVIKAMHQTAVPKMREWARENILDAEIDNTLKVVTLRVTNEEVRKQMVIGGATLPILQAVEIAYPGYRLSVQVKEPLDLSALTVAARATEKQTA